MNNIKLFVTVKKILTLERDLSYYICASYLLYFISLCMFNNNKSLIYIIQDIGQLFIYIISVYIMTYNYGNMKSYIYYNFFTACISCIGMSLLDQINFLDKFIMKGSIINEWNYIHYLFFIIFLIFNLFVIFYNYYYCLSIFFIIKVIIILCYTLISIIITLINEKIVHIHHWYLCYCLMILSCANTNFAQTMHYIYLGIFIQGISIYSISVLYD